ncbi:GCK domain [Arabidopsis thaliana x Arabidopsis arenosa]|uniref:GCK domain n=1 Tax=Arabidopsis thaliana x Arabidopsis arenosa TaxID=1240361 RepID=A0A8T2BZM6_9BRAS|nr:GCK domain [Arabidopsis thaliana x Arabidopsis arenosa]
MSSTDLKAENTDPKSQNNQVPSEELGDSSSDNWLYRFQDFMEGGACKESYLDLIYCFDDEEPKYSEILENCMKAHSDYYEPVIARLETCKEQLTKDLEAVFLPSTLLDQRKEGDIEKEESFIAFMKGGSCKESYTAWSDCAKEAEKNKEDVNIKCAEVSEMWNNCMDAHSDYYHPYLAPIETAANDFAKKLEAFVSRKQAE